MVAGAGAAGPPSTDARLTRTSGPAARCTDSLRHRVPAGPANSVGSASSLSVSRQTTLSTPSAVVNWVQQELARAAAAARPAPAAPARATVHQDSRAPPAAGMQPDGSQDW